MTNLNLMGNFFAGIIFTTIISGIVYTIYPPNKQPHRSNPPPTQNIGDQLSKMDFGSSDRRY